MKVYNVSGLSVTVIEDYKIAWAKSYGVTEPGGATPVRAKTLFQAGSDQQTSRRLRGCSRLYNKGTFAGRNVNEKLKTWKVPENEFKREQKGYLAAFSKPQCGLTVHGFPGYDVDEKGADAGADFHR